jgi:hypothetical protein
MEDTGPLPVMNDVITRILFSSDIIIVITVNCGGEVHTGL